MFISFLMGSLFAAQKSAINSLPQSCNELRGGESPHHRVVSQLLDPLAQAHCTPALAKISSHGTDRTRNASAPTSPRSTGLCAIQGFISSGSSSRCAFAELSFLAGEWRMRGKELTRKRGGAVT